MQHFVNIFHTLGKFGVLKRVCIQRGSWQTEFERLIEGALCKNLLFKMS